MGRDASASGVVVAWDPALVRFGADTLNQRFQSRFGRVMDEDAWCAWMAVKVLWESALRVRSAAPDRLVEFLSRDTTQFDGHKGRPLSFRRWDQQLRQPLYVRRGESLVEVPVAAGEESSRDLLDRLGTRASESSCKL
jgi:ABC transporter substrate binding protein (PQQ-dependent alcohol dehydrogenase system)